MLEGLTRRYAVWRYRNVLPAALVRRYGRNRAYTPAQVVTTIRVERLSERYAPYACALFCTKREFRAYADQQRLLLTSDAPNGLSTAAALGYLWLRDYGALRADISVPGGSAEPYDAGGWQGSASGGEWGDASGIDHAFGDGSSDGSGAGHDGGGGGGGGGDGGSEN